METVMTKSNIILAVTALVSTVVALSSDANANGVRLSFGGPMASFVATPTHGGGGGSSHRSASSGYGQGAAKCKPKSAPTKVARAHREEPRVKVVRHEARPQPRYEPKVVRHEPKHEPKRVVAAVERDRPAKVAKVTKAVSETVVETKEAVAVNDTPVTASGAKSLAQTQVDASQPAVTTDVATAVEATTTVATTEAPVVAPPETLATVPTEVTAAADVGCKKFIPAVGVTVSVDCEK
jgi:hypothetical protein